jgi:hypothetical protein
MIPLILSNLIFKDKNPFLLFLLMTKVSFSDQSGRFTASGRADT